MPTKTKTSAGDLNRKITIQRGETTYNELNEPVTVWVDLMTVSAKRVDASDSQRIEYMAAAQVGAFTLARFTIRSSFQARSITATDRLMHEGDMWAIRGVKEADEGLHRYLEIMAVKDAD